MAKKAEVKKGMERAQELALKGAAGALTTAVDFAADAGLGLEGTDKASFAIPFLAVLQSNSPALDTVDGAKAGMFMNTVTNELYSEALVIPVAFQRRYLAWAPRTAGGGFRGEHSVLVVEGAANELGWKKNAMGQLELPDGAVLKDTRNHFIILLTEDGGSVQALLSLSSTQIKKSKRWMSRIQSIQMKTPAGKLYTPPSFSHVYKLTTLNESNEKGTWKGIQVDLVGPVADPEQYAAAKHFHTLVVAGKVEVATPPAEGEGGEAF